MKKIVVHEIVQIKRLTNIEVKNYYRRNKPELSTLTWLWAANTHGPCSRPSTWANQLVLGADHRHGQHIGASVNNLPPSPAESI